MPPRVAQQRSHPAIAITTILPRQRDDILGAARQSRCEQRDTLAENGGGVSVATRAEAPRSHTPPTPSLIPFWLAMLDPKAVSCGETVVRQCDLCSTPNHNNNT